ncbi:F0F1 ATP synthase subunit gamma [Bradyrhizobium sp. HKCCYLRH2060]|uniref:F0F1 ATP synthase subunit gamma n=1 Tax=Bradyrhizobium TaxID=374 RepID=UPI00291660A4|nr:F0F1 ATP synthase subunit gamma [Bradyrhizobium sp. SZCCHNR3003]
MAERLAEVSAQIQNVRQLEAVVTALRGIAASRSQRARSLLAGIDSYSAVVSRAIGQALTLLPADFRDVPKKSGAPIGVILFCAEQGFAGAFSERVLNAAGGGLANATTFLIGTRGLVVARERGLTPSWSAPMASHVDAVPSLANNIADALYAQIARATPSTIEMIVPRSAPGIGVRIERHSLLPLDLARFAGDSETLPPMTTLKPQELLERLTAEYVYARLCEAAMHSYEAENQARMMTMTAARNNIGTRLVTLGHREQQLRQEEITNEIVELAAGAEALADR